MDVRLLGLLRTTRLAASATKPVGQLLRVQARLAQLEDSAVGPDRHATCFSGMASPCSMCVLSTTRPDVRRLLDWAVSCKTPIDASAAQKGALQAELCQWDDVTGVSVTLLDTMMHMIADSLIHDTKICGEGHGFELWRSFNARWHGRSDQVLQATLRAYITPTRWSTPLQLWETLPSWEQKAAELALANQPVSEMLKAQALLDVVPDSLRRDITGRPELAAYEPRLRFVKD